VGGTKHYVPPLQEVGGDLSPCPPYDRRPCCREGSRNAYTACYTVLIRILKKIRWIKKIGWYPDLPNYQEKVKNRPTVRLIFGWVPTFLVDIRIREIIAGQNRQKFCRKACSKQACWLIDWLIDWLYGLFFTVCWVIGVYCYFFIGTVVHWNLKSRLSRGKDVSAGLKRIWQSRDIAVATKVRLLKALVWPVAAYGCESWTLRTADEKRIQAFEMRGLRQILCVSWTAKRTNDWVLDKAEVSRSLL